MHNSKARRKAIRTVRRKQSADLLAVLFFLLLLPYTCSVLTTEPAENKNGSAATAAAVSGSETAVETLAAASSRYILWEKENGTWKIPAEEFLLGALAGSIPGDYREETLKAQAVILRSISLADQEQTEEQTVGTENFSLAESGISYQDRESRERLWKENTEESEAKFTRAVQATSGIVLTFEEKIVSPPYFRLSAGQTRDSSQIWEAEDFSWCRSVSCPHNLEAEEYLQTVTVKRNAFLKKLEQEGILMDDSNARMVLTRDSAGYVLFVECSGQQIEGERFRMLFDLASSCFSIREEGKNMIITTKGIGHGLGFDQYAADLLAAAGQDYQGLLNSFFDGLTLEKVE